MNGQVFAIHVPTVHAKAFGRSFPWAFRAKNTCLPTTHRSAVRLAGALLATTMLAGFATPVHAQSVNWNGSVSSDWDDPANWDANLKPGPDDIVFIDNDTATSSVSTESGDYTIKRLAVGVGQGTNSHLYVDGSLSFSGSGSTSPDLIGENGGKGRVDVRGFWRSAGVNIGTGFSNGPSEGTLIVSGIAGVPARLEAGFLTVGDYNGKGTLSIDNGSSALTGDIAIGIHGGTGNVRVANLSTLMSGNIDVGRGSFFASGGLVDADNVRVGFDGTGSSLSLQVSTLTASSIQVGGYRGSDGSTTSGTGRIDLTSNSSLETGYEALKANSSSRVGQGAGSVGNVSIDNSRWANAKGLWLGAGGGSGTIVVDHTGRYTEDAFLIVGSGAGSAGGITLDTGSHLSVGTNMSIGTGGGSGAVRLFLVSSAQTGGSLSVGGTAEAEAVGSSYFLDAGVGSLGIFDGSNVSTNTDLTTRINAVGAGQGGDGRIRIAGQGSSLSFGGRTMVGVGAGATGVIEVAGLQTALNFGTGETLIGSNGGNGSIRVDDGGAMTVDGNLGIGTAGGANRINPAAANTLGQVSFTDSKLTTNQSVAVGADGAQGDVYLSASTWNANGPVSVGLNGGTGSIWGSGNNSLASSQLFTVGSGANAVGALRLEGSTWTHNGAILVGASNASGTLDLYSGSSAIIDLGTTRFTLGDTGGDGVLHIDGAGTTLVQTNGSVVLGTNGGSGGITARNGGSFTGTGGLVAGTGAGSNGVLAAVGAGSRVTIDGPVAFGSAGGSGYVAARDGGIVDIGLNNSTILFADGAGSAGGFDVDDGGKLTFRGSATLGGPAAAFGSIDGAGSQLSMLQGPLLLTNGAIDVTNGGTLFTDRGATIGGPAAGSSRITISGLGSSWIASGDIYVGGPGAAGNAGTSARGELFVTNGAGVGAANANLRVATGGGTGTVLIDMDSRIGAGNYSQGVGGTLMIGLDPTTNGRSGRLTSDGSISFADNTHISFFTQAGGRYHLGDRYEVVRSFVAPIARGKINFDGLDQQTLFVGLVPTFQLLGQGEVLYLDVAQNRSFASVAKTPNQATTAAGADSLVNANALKAALLDLQTEDQARGAFDRLSGELYPSIRTALIEDARLPRMAVLARLTEAEGGAGAWMQGFGNWGSTDSDGNAATLDRNTKGGLIGLDGSLGDGKLRLGLAGGYSDGTLSVADRGSRADLKSYNALGYIGGTFGGLRLRVGVGYTWSSIDAARSIAFPGFTDNVRGKFDATTLQGFGEIGYRVPASGGWVEPFAGISAVRVQTDGMQESGGTAALTVRDQRQSSTSSTLGLKASTSADGPITAGVTLGWQHRFGDRTPRAILNFTGGAPFSITGVPLAKDAAVAEVSLGLRLRPGTAVSLRYSGAIGQRSVDNALKATLSIGF